jgi:hypothetical protein
MGRLKKQKSPKLNCKEFQAFYVPRIGLEPIRPLRVTGF